MSDLIYDFFASAIDIVINAAILAGVVSLIMLITLLGRNVTEQQANSEQLAEYRKYAMYNNQILTLSDYQSSLAQLIGNTRISIIDETNGNSIQYNYQDIKADDRWYRFDKTNSDLKVTAELFAPMVDGGAIKPWESGTVGGVQFKIKAR